MMAIGPPGPDEIALLEPFRAKVAAEVFGEPFVPPVSDGSGQDRVLLRKASALLQEAGYHIKQGKRITPEGNLFTAEFLIAEPSRCHIIMLSSKISASWASRRTFALSTRCNITGA